MIFDNQTLVLNVQLSEFYNVLFNDWLIDWCFTPTLAIFQLYRGSFQWKRTTILMEKKLVTYSDISSIEAQLVIFRVERGGGATGSDVTWSHVTRKRDRKWRQSRDQKWSRVHPQPEVAQYSPEVTSSNVTWPRSESLGRVRCAHAQPEVAWLPEVMSWNATRRASPGKYRRAHTRPELPLGCDLICSGERWGARQWRHRNW